jgi:hypothetical protein
MFHKHATPRRICITADKLRLNTLSCASTHASGVRLLSPPARWLPPPHGLRASKVEPRLASASVPKLLQMLSAEFPPNYRPIAASTCQRCQMQAHVGHRTARLPALDIIFRSLWQRLSSGDWRTAVSVSREKYNTPPPHEAVSFCCVKLAEMTLEINLYELTAPFERCILKTMNGNSGKFF